MHIFQKAPQEASFCIFFTRCMVHFIQGRICIPKIYWQVLPSQRKLLQKPYSFELKRLMMAGNKIIQLWNTGKPTVYMTSCVWKISEQLYLGGETCFPCFSGFVNMKFALIIPWTWNFTRIMTGKQKWHLYIALLWCFHPAP